MNTFPDIHTTGAVHHWIQWADSPRPVYLGTAEVSPQVVLEQYYAGQFSTQSGERLPFQKEYLGQAATVSVLLSRWDKHGEFEGLINGFNTATRGSYKIFPVENAAPAKDEFIQLVSEGFFIERVPLSSISFEEIDDTSGGAVGGIISGGGRLETDKPEAEPVTIATTNSGAPVGSESRWSRGSLVFGNRDVKLWQVFDFALHKTVRSAHLEIGRYWPQATLDTHAVVAAGTQAQKILLTFSCEPRYNPQYGGNVFASDEANQRGWMLYSINPAFFPAAVQVPR